MSGIKQIIDSYFGLTNKLYECPNKFNIPPKDPCPGAIFNKRTGDYFPRNCEKWSCPYCGNKKRNNLYRRMIHGDISRWPIKHHVILTVNDDETNKNIDKFFNRLNKEIHQGYYIYESDDIWKDKNKKEHKIWKVRDKKNIRRTDKLIFRPNLKYLWVKEFQGERFLLEGKWFRHLHIIVNQRLSKYDLIPIWNHITNKIPNYIEDRSVKTWDNGKYLMKYLTKAEYQDQFENGEKRYSSSRGILGDLKKIPKTNKPGRPKAKEWIWVSLETARCLNNQFDKNQKRFRANFDRILELCKWKEKFIISSLEFQTFIEELI